MLKNCLSRLLPLLAWLSLGNNVFAQVDTVTTEEEEDFSQYADMSSVDGKKARTYCTQKVFGQTPSRLISVGYELQGPFDMEFGLPSDGGTAAITAKGVIANSARVEANFPVISRNKMILNLAGSYLLTNYTFPDELTTGPDGPGSTAAEALRTLPLHAFAVNSVLFKPFDAANFILVQLQGEYNFSAGDFAPDVMDIDFRAFDPFTWSGVALYGRKVHDRLMWGVGVTRTFRAGEINYLPVVMYNYSAPSQRWGIEALLPARADFRYSFTPRSILRTGVELEGGTYGSRSALLRRSEIKLRAAWEVPVRGFWSLQLTAGYRIVYNYNVDRTADKDMFRGLFGTQPYLSENRVGGAPFVGISMNLVSP